MFRFTTIGIRLTRIKHPERIFTASLRTGIAFRAAIDTAATTARGRMDFVDGFPRLAIRDVKDGNAVVVPFLDDGQGGTTRGNLGRLVAATLAGSHSTCQGTFDGKQFRLGTDFQNSHGKRMDGSVCAMNR